MRGLRELQFRERVRWLLPLPYEGEKALKIPLAEIYEKGENNAVEHFSGAKLMRDVLCAFLHAEGYTYSSCGKIVGKAVGYLAHCGTVGDLPRLVYGQTNIVDNEGNTLGRRHLTAPEKLTLASFVVHGVVQPFVRLRNQSARGVCCLFHKGGGAVGGGAVGGATLPLPKSSLWPPLPTACLYATKLSWLSDGYAAHTTYAIASLPTTNGAYAASSTHATMPGLPTRCLSTTSTRESPGRPPAFSYQVVKVGQDVGPEFREVSGRGYADLQRVAICRQGFKTQTEMILLNTTFCVDNPAADAFIEFIKDTYIPLATSCGLYAPLLTRVKASLSIDCTFLPKNGASMAISSGQYWSTSMLTRSSNT